ncbi:4302_t:CDS:2, partial [Gigaspora rosea]
QFRAESKIYELEPFPLQSPNSLNLTFFNYTENESNTNYTQNPPFIVGIQTYDKSGRLKLQTSGYIQSAPKYSLFNTALFTNDNGYMDSLIYPMNMDETIRSISCNTTNSIDYVCIVHIVNHNDETLQYSKIFLKSK